MGVKGLLALTKKLGGFIWFHKVGKASPIGVRDERVEKHLIAI